MANDFSTIAPAMVARGLLALRSYVALPRLVRGDFSQDAAKPGSTIDVPLPVARAASAVTPAVTFPATVAATVPVAQIALDQWYRADFDMTDKEMKEVPRTAGLLPMEASEALKSLGDNMNTYVANLYRYFYGYTGTAATTPFASTVVDAVNARKVLNQQAAPKDGRAAVLDFDAEANALALAPFSDAEKIGSSEVKINGEIGRKFGIFWTAGDFIPTHTKGTLVGTAAIITNGAVTADATARDGTVSLDATTLAGTLLVGDIITFAGHSQTYTVVENTASAQYLAGTGPFGGYTAATNAIASVKFRPGPQVTIADGTAVTLKASHVANLVFHRDAIAFAQRPVLDPDQEAIAFQLTDPATGVSLRLEKIRLHKMTRYEWDVLYGAQVLRSELGMRIAG